MEGGNSDINNSMKRKSNDISTGDNNNDNNDDDDDDDPSVHWERCQQSHKKRVKKMKEQKDKLENEIATMNSMIGGGRRGGESSITDINIAAADDDVIEIDAGGKIIRALRSTLTLAPDTMFTFMFSGRWEESLKRHNDRVILDHDPELIEIIINFLRMKKIEDPSMKAILRSPKIHVDKKENFDSLLRYFGLTDFFYPPRLQHHHHELDIAKINAVQSHDNDFFCFT
jgi:hypothetical protein